MAIGGLGSAISSGSLLARSRRRAIIEVDRRGARREPLRHSGDDVRQKQVFQPGDPVLEDELSLLHPLNLDGVAALTTLPVFGVPVQSRALSGLDSLYSIVQMPAGVPVGTLAIGEAGAVNAALLAASVLALSDPLLAARLEAWRKAQTDQVADRPASNG